VADEDWNFLMKSEKVALSSAGAEGCGFGDCDGHCLFPMKRMRGLWTLERINDGCILL